MNKTMAIAGDNPSRSDARSGATCSGRLPEFMIIGAMKAGTTTLYEYLLRHREIFMCPNKEPMFFSREPVYARGLEWYRSLFSGASDDQRCGEASTCYSRWPHYDDVPARIAQVVPDVKLIYLMRHPVERAYSHYGHLVFEGVNQSFEQALESEPQITDTSLYMRQINRFLTHFDRQQLLLLTFDDLKGDTVGVLEQVQRFLEVRPADLLADGPIMANPAGGVPARRRISDVLRSLRGMPGILHLADAVGSTGRSSVYRRLLNLISGSFIARHLARRHRSRISPLLPETRRRLLETFAPATRELERFMERRLDEWFI